MRNPFGWAYPAGAENDPRAPYNQPYPEVCEHCDSEIDVDGCNCVYCEDCDERIPEDTEDGLCVQCRKAYDE
jgi:hypothetical protein